MKTNWRRLGDILADVTSSRERLAEAANSAPREENAADAGAPAAEFPGTAKGGGDAGGQPNKIRLPGRGNRTRSADQWTVRPPGKRRDANAPATPKIAAGTNAIDPTPPGEQRRVLRVSDGKRLSAASPMRSPTAVALRRLTFSGKAHGDPSSQSGSSGGVWASNHATAANAANTTSAMPSSVRLA